MFLQAIRADFSALRLLFKNRVMLLLLVAMYGALLLAGYLFVSTREATISQLLVTLGLVVVAPVLFFALQAVSVNYVSGPGANGLVRKSLYDSLRLVAV